MKRLEWITRRVPSKPKWLTVKSLMNLKRQELAERCWAAEANCDGFAYAASEAWARCAELVEMLEKKRPVEKGLIQALARHRDHVIACRMGSCEHEFAALVRAGIAER